VSAPRLAARGAELLQGHLKSIVIPLYHRAELTPDEQFHHRGKPLPYLLAATQLVREFGLKTIVEIGSMRQPMHHALSSFNPLCCNDGHSTAHFAHTGAEVFSVDADPRCAALLQPLAREFPNLHVVTDDGLHFLSGFDRSIDLLFLDAWDVIAGIPYAENHLEAYRRAAPHLAPTCLVQIDDTDLMNGGKGRLVIPQMIRDGFELLTWGRQALLVREP
jgi:hypothetical protein